MRILKGALLCITLVCLLGAIYNYFQTKKLQKLARHNYGFATLKELEQKIDSQVIQEFGPSASTEQYMTVLSKNLQSRFNYNTSRYSWATNYIAALLNGVVGKDYTDLVLTNDILLHENAVCNQTTLVAADLLRLKKIDYQPVSFEDTGSSGHFAYQVYYDSSWHYYDDSFEPDFSFINNQHPGINEIMNGDSVLEKMYQNVNLFEGDRNKTIQDFKSIYRIGDTNEIIASNAKLFQRVTKFLSYWGWVFPLMIYLIIRKKKVKQTLA